MCALCAYKNLGSWSKHSFIIKYQCILILTEFTLCARPSVRPSVRAITRERFDLLTPNLACRSLWPMARSLLIFSPLGQTPRSRVNLMFLILLYGELFMRVIESSHQIKYFLTSRSDPKVKVQTHMAPKDFPHD